MKLSIIAALSIVAVAAGFAPSVSNPKVSTALHAEESRKMFLSTAAAVVFGAAVAGPAMAMDQDNVNEPTEQWETGKPTPAAEKARIARYANARTQMTSNFPPIKRLNLERKSPVTRLDINAPGFDYYKKSLPGLFRG